MSVPAEPLRTDRLELRPLALGDLDDFLALYSREDVVRYLYTTPMDRERMLAWLSERVGWDALREGQDCMKLAAVLRDGGAFVGEMTLWRTSAEHAQGEVGFLIHPDHQGHGYATEAAQALLAVGFEQAGFHRVVGRLDARNTASAAVLERLGMRREAHLLENELVKGEWTDELVYAILEREWRAANER